MKFVTTHSSSTHIFLKCDFTQDLDRPGNNVLLFGVYSKRKMNDYTKQSYYVKVKECRGRVRPRLVLHDQVTCILSQGGDQSLRNQHTCIKIVMKAEEAREILIFIILG